MFGYSRLGPIATPSARRRNEPGQSKTLKITTDQIEQKFGKGAIMKLGENTNMQVGVIPTGALP